MATKKSNAKETTPAIDWSQDFGAGFETVTRDDLGLPLLSIIQKMSPEVDEDNAKYIEGVKPGDVLFSLTKETIATKGNSLLFVPCGYQKAFNEWTPRESGGGFVAAHDQTILDHCSKNEKGQDVLDNGNLVVPTAYVHGYFLNPESGDWEFGIIPMSSTQLKKARQWLNLMSSHKIKNGDRMQLLPMFSHKYRLTTVPESNEHGTWHGWKIETDTMVTELELVNKARDSHKEIASSGTQSLLAAPAEVEEDPFE